MFHLVRHVVVYEDIITAAISVNISAQGIDYAKHVAINFSVNLDRVVRDLFTILLLHI